MYNIIIHRFNYYFSINKKKINKQKNYINSNKEYYNILRVHQLFYLQNQDFEEFVQYVVY